MLAALWISSVCSGGQIWGEARFDARRRELHGFVKTNGGESRRLPTTGQSSQADVDEVLSTGCGRERQLSFLKHHIEKYRIYRISNKVIPHQITFANSVDLGDSFRENHRNSVIHGPYIIIFLSRIYSLRRG
jgi:hypothetical protein